jgi:uncharacterized protein YjbI with pentapeptide repeats
MGAAVVWEVEVMDRDEALRLLRGGPEGIAEWNRRRAADEEIPDFVRADLRKANLRKANLRKANLRGADLRGADLSGADLSGWTALSGADLRKANLTDANLREVGLSGANLSGANLRKVNLTDANLGLAALSRVDLTGASLMGANLRGADLRKTNLRRANLFMTDLRKANLRGADLTKANLGLADLTGVNLSGANLSRADLTGANLSGANLSGANLTLARLIRCSLDDAIFDEADVSDCHVQETIGRPKPPRLLRIKGCSPLTGEDARNFFNPPATVEVYLTGRLTELELGCYHFHLGDMYYQQVGIGVHFVGFRHEGDGSVLRFQGETFDDVYRVLPDLLAPFRFSEAIDWERTFAAMPAERRTEATLSMVQLAAKTPRARYRIAERIGLYLDSFKNARFERIRTKSGNGEAVQILVANNERTIQQIEEERLAELEERRKPLQLTVYNNSKIFMLEGDYMSRDIHARDVVGSTIGDNNTLQARDINYQQLWNQAGSSIDLPALAEELGRLRATMRQEASEPEHDEELGAVASAEKAAKQSDGPRALEYLKAAGKWTLGIAEKIGTELAVAAMKKTMGAG